MLKMIFPALFMLIQMFFINFIKSDNRKIIKKPLQSYIKYAVGPYCVLIW